MDYYLRTTLTDDGAREGGREGIVERFPTSVRLTSRVQSFGIIK